MVDLSGFRSLLSDRPPPHEVNRKFLGTRWAVSEAQAVNFYHYSEDVPVDYYKDVGGGTEWHWYLVAEPA